MVKLAIAAILVLGAVAVAVVARRRQRRQAPVARQFHVPTHLNRADFAGTAPWLVAVFTSATCHTCADVASKAAVLRSAEVDVVEVEFGDQRAAHERYAIDAVPLVLVADADGTVQASFIGPVSATDLWAAVAELRQPGSLPGGGHCSSEAGASAAEASSGDGSESMLP